MRLNNLCFRYKHSIITQLLSVVDNVATTLNYKHKTTTALLDIKKTFDKVWHDGLLYKFGSIGVPTQLLNMVKNCDKFSTTKQVNADVQPVTCVVLGILK